MAKPKEETNKLSDILKMPLLTDDSEKSWKTKVQKASYSIYQSGTLYQIKKIQQHFYETKKSEIRNEFSIAFQEEALRELKKSYDYNMNRIEILMKKKFCQELDSSGLWEEKFKEPMPTEILHKIEKDLKNSTGFFLNSKTKC